MYGNEHTVSGIKNGNYKGQELPPTEKDAKALLKEILTEAEYNRIAGDVSSNLTLTAQTIKAVGDTFSVLESDAKNGTLQDTTKTAVNNNKEAFVARAEEKISVSKNGTTYTITYDTKVKFNGEFNLSEISLPDNNGNGDFSSATLTNNGESITIDKFNNIRGSYLPILKFTNVKDTLPEHYVYNNGYQHAIYFSDDFNSLKDNPDEIKKLCDKFSNNQPAGFISVYLGKDRVNGPSYVDAKDTIGAKNPRSLKEFEYFGNNFEDNNKRRFEKSAKETYGNEFDSLSSYDQSQLNIDPYTIAQNNKRCFPGGAKRCV